MRKIAIKESDLSIQEMHRRFMNYNYSKNLTERTLKGYEHLLDNWEWDEIN